mmetsp:Transcript_18648/g.33716  ORF Transcript_18648/g.33716 Transcript_18648/m.33716 type:complete len:102 (+) Transcript_18648:1029-1334(+)
MIRKKVELTLEQDTSYFAADTLQGLVEYALKTLYGHLGSAIIHYELEITDARRGIIEAEAGDMVKIGAALALIGQYAVSRCKVRLTDLETEAKPKEGRQEA